LTDFNALDLLTKFFCFDLFWPNVMRIQVKKPIHSKDDNDKDNSSKVIVNIKKIAVHTTTIKITARFFQLINDKSINSQNPFCFKELKHLKRHKTKLQCVLNKQNNIVHWCGC